MKKLIRLFISLLLLGLPWACAGLLPEPRVEDLARSNTSYPGLQLLDLRQGRALYMKNCAGCHALHAPSQLDSFQWERIMSKMQLKAKINDSTKDSIMKYLLTFAKED